MKKNKDEKRVTDKKRKDSSGRIGFVFTLVPLILTIILVSRVIPDGAYRISFAESVVPEKVIALTFEDGPSDYTEELLSALRHYNVKVSFFVLGANAEKNPEIIRQAYDDGHLIANHGYTHQNLYAVSPKKAKALIDKTDEIIKNITNQKLVFYRPAYGYINSLSLKMYDRVIVNWSKDTYDWRHKDADVIYEKIMECAGDGEIILLHDTKRPTVEAVIRAIPDLQEQGYEFVRVDDLLTRNNHKLKMGVPYRKCEYDREPLIY